ncbi:MAG: hypothetical protein AB8G11_10960 [Saprospiraceae bacterium]
MKNFIYIFLVFMLSSCQNVFLIKKSKNSISSLESRKTDCDNLSEFIHNNMFYISRKNSYLLSHSFQTVLFRYKECLEQLSYQEAVKTFGKPSCQTDNQSCYYLYFELPQNVSFNDLRLNPQSFVIVLTKDGNGVRLGKDCNCEK